MKLGDIYALKQEDYDTLLKYGSVEIGGVVYTLKSGAIYVTPKKDYLTVGESKIISGKTEDGESYIEFVFPGESE